MPQGIESSQLDLAIVHCVTVATSPLPYFLLCEMGQWFRGALRSVSSTSHRKLAPLKPCVLHTVHSLCVLGPVFVIICLVEL